MTDVLRWLEDGDVLAQSSEDTPLTVYSLGEWAQREPSNDSAETTTLPCGCVLVTVPASLAASGANTLTVMACRAGCEMLAFMLREADEVEMPVEVHEVRT